MVAGKLGELVFPAGSFLLVPFQGPLSLSAKYRADAEKLAKRRVVQARFRLAAEFTMLAR